MVLDRKEKREVRKPTEFTGCWSASQLGCWRQMYLLARGFAGEFRESAVLEEGRLHEDDIIARLRVHGISIDGRFEELKHPELPLTGHPDGSFQLDTQIDFLEPGKYVLEVKSMDRAFWYRARKNFKDYFPHLYRQIQAYLMMKSEHRAYTVIKNRASGEVYEEIIEPDLEVQDEIATYLKLLLRMIDIIDFDYMVISCPDINSITARYCPYKSMNLCEHQTNIVSYSDEEVAQAVADYREARSLEKVSTEMNKRARAVLVAYMKSHGLDRAVLSGAKAKFEQRTRKSIDTELLKSILDTDTYNAVEIETVYDYFELREQR